MTVNELRLKLLDYPLTMKVYISTFDGDGTYREDIYFDTQSENVTIEGSITAENNKPDTILILH